LIHQLHLDTSNGQSQEFQAHIHQPGRNQKETFTNIREAIEGYLEEFPEDLDNQTEQHERRRYKGLSAFFF
jgi:transposase